MADQIEVKAEDRTVPSKKTGSSRWGRRFLTMLIATAAVGGFAVVVVYSYEKGRSARTDAAIPVITAQEGPTKLRPKDPGGMEVPNQDKLVYGRLNVAERPKKVERLLPPPEAVVSHPPPLPLADSASSPSEKADKALNQVAKSLSAIEPAAGNPNVAPPAVPPQPPAPKVTPEKQGSENKAMEVAKLSAASSQAASPAGPAYHVQLASVRSRRAAEKAWGQYKFDHAALLGKLQSKIVRVELKGKGTFYRLQAGPLADASAAQSLCSEVKKHKIGCIVVRP